LIGLFQFQGVEEKKKEVKEDPSRGKNRSLRDFKKDRNKGDRGIFQVPP
jgi:hypothetical protein